MAGCSVLGCCNRSEKGFTMKYFPRDPQRRKEWIANMKRKNWIPTAYSVICEVHFAPEMWEKTRVDGKKKLKRMAIPTLFSFDKPASVKKTPQEPVKIPAEVADANMPSTSDDIRTPSTDAGSTSDIKMPSTSDHIHTPSTDTNSTSKPSESATGADKRIIKELELKCRQYNKQFAKLFTNYRILKNNLRNCQNKLKAATNVDGSVKVMRTVFNEDQITALKRSSTKFMKWSPATVKKALKLKYACGVNGYKELLNQKYPLPSLRTLRRHQEKLKLKTVCIVIIDNENNNI